MEDRFNSHESSEYTQKLSNFKDEGLSCDVKEIIIRGALDIYEDFKKAYSYIEAASFDSAKRRFEQLLSENEELLALIRRLTDKDGKLLLERDILYAVVLALEMVDKSTHNLWVIQLKADRGKEAELLYNRNAYAKAELIFYRKLAKVFDACDLESEEESGKIVHRFCKPLSELYFFAFCIDGGDETLEKYLSSVRGKEGMHCYNVYREIIKQNTQQAVEKINTVGEYLCQTVDSLATKRILYHSIFYESAALEYAYKNGLYDAADKILGCGYDHYRELDTLHLVFRYEKDRFNREEKDLKKLCLERGIALTGENYFYEHRYIRNLYGDDFCDEFVGAAEHALADLKNAAPDDPRLRNNRSTPDWAK